MAGRPWTSEEFEFIKNGHHKKVAISEMALKIGRSEPSIRHKLKELGLTKTRSTKSKIFTPSEKQSLEDASYDFENSLLKAELKEMKQKVKEAELRIVQPEWEDDWDGDTEWARAEQKGIKAIDKASKRGRFKVNFDSGPIAISVISDQHIAPGTPCDFKRMKEDAELIRNTKGFYAVFGGDGVDNHIKHRSALIGANSTPDEQWRLFDYYLQLFGDKILAIISGNHDAWTAQIGGVDYLSKLANNQKVCYAPAEARLDITVQDQMYKMVVRHQTGRFNSSLNQTHAVKRFYENNEELFDVGVIGHHHEAAVEMFIKHGQKRYAARPGSYQISSPYSHQYGFARSIPTCPTFVFFPGERRIIGFDDVRNAAWALEGKM
tara:strand:- start:2095 stop:3228 length:1134 start_codon:yes stop_codon:yes gene_type:complete